MNDLRLDLIIKGITEENRRDKFAVATEQLAKAMGLPVTIKPRADETKAEEYSYKAQEEFTQAIILHLAGMMDDVYHATCEYLDLPVIHTFSKGFFDRFLTVKGKMRFNPVTGKPLKWADFQKLAKAIENFLNLGITNLAKKITLGSEALARLMAFVEKNTSPDAARKMTMEQLKGRGHNFDKLSTDMRTFAKDFDIEPQEIERLEVVEQQVGDRFKDLASESLQRVKDVYYQGVIQKKTKGEMSQELFDRFGDQNRDWRRVVETEHVEIFNNAYLKDQVAKTPEGEKVYFKRREIMDGHTCKFCAKIKDKVVLWSDTPLSSEKINDPETDTAIWEGKSNMGRKAADYWVPAGASHPSCRGSWERYTVPVADEFTDEIAKILERKKQRDIVYQEAIKELRSKKKFDSETTGEFEKELNSLYTEKLKETGLL